MTEHPEIVPIWGWYAIRGDNRHLVRASRMTKAFSYEAPTGAMRGQAGEWLVEDPDGTSPRAMPPNIFEQLYEPVEPGRPERVQPPDPAPPLEGPPIEPPKEVA